MIPDPDADFLPIPDPGVKKAPDPGSGSGSATLNPLHKNKRLLSADVPDAGNGETGLGNVGGQHQLTLSLAGGPQRRLLVLTRYTEQKLKCWRNMGTN
jgi:hypothetical protein